MVILKKALKYAGVGIGIFILFILGLAYSQATRPVSLEANPVIFEIEKGMTLKRIAQTLGERQLIHSPSAFRLLAFFKNKQSQIHAGEFELSPSMTPGEILQRITSGQTVLYTVTIPEGYRITEIAALFAEKGLVDAETFIQLSESEELAHSLGIQEKNLEGYLYPETYSFSKNTGEKKIIQTMVETFNARILKPEYIERAKETGFTFHEIITLAALIEKETGKDEERKLISSVFHNRLKKKMRLQCDPTVIYIIKDFDGNLRKRDLFLDSPYNTYRYSGLPPGPIASPGKGSIEAALFPADTDHLYFVSKQDGSHQFTSNLVDHNRAVRKYQLKRVNDR